MTYETNPQPTNDGVELVMPPRLEEVSADMTEIKTHVSINKIGVTELTPPDFRESGVLSEEELSKLLPETRAALQQLTGLAESWEQEGVDQKVFFATALQVTNERTEAGLAQTRRREIAWQMIPLADLDLQAAREREALQQEKVKIASERYIENAQEVESQKAEVRTMMSAIEALREDKKKKKADMAMFKQRHKELASGRTSDGSPAQPLNEDERLLYIVEGVAYGHLQDTLADVNYIPGSPQERNRAVAVIDKILDDFRHAINELNRRIPEAEQEMIQARQEALQAEDKKDNAHRKYVSQDLKHQERVGLRQGAESIYAETRKAPSRLVGRPEIPIGDAVNQRLMQERDRNAIAAAAETQRFVFSGAGQLSEADKAMGREPLAIEGSSFSVALKGIAARVKVRGLGTTGQIEIGYPQRRNN